MSEPIDYNASALDMFMAISPILNPNGATTDIDPDFDRETRTPSKPYTDNVAVTRIGNVFLITFQGEHRDLQIDDIDTTKLTTNAPDDESGSQEKEAQVTTVTLGGTDADTPEGLRRFKLGFNAADVPLAHYGYSVGIEPLQLMSKLTHS